MKVTVCSYEEQVPPGEFVRRDYKLKKGALNPDLREVKGTDEDVEEWRLDPLGRYHPPK
ncbi:hypothetical protein [Ancylobacter mangrovi]|uniref:hypothetical protein n=1 Tax=Ancylobacter mangrovi TaxID=2972472 RepID=UPI002162C8BF|nr:hypothetical protein [Ancylobacter mangrovi]MCS0501359.1 hypothetical protein [Ancylobacter mangrovi]